MVAAGTQAPGTAGSPRVDVTSVFAALGDPTRAALLTKLAADGRGTATTLTAVTDISRQAVDRHLRVLAGARLIESHREGREVVYGLNTEALRGSAEWLERLGRSWDNRLLALKKEAERAR